MGYIKLLKTHPRTLGFGFLHSLFSNMGQTHFVALFSPLIMAKFSLSNTQYGSLYSLVTLASGLILPFIGPLMDRKDARLLGTLMGVGLILSELFLIHSPHIFLVAIGLFGLRLFGQGLCTTLSSIVITRYFSLERGKALSLTFLGYPMGEGAITPMVAFLLPTLGMVKIGYILITLVLLIFIPLNLLLTKNTPQFNKAFDEQENLKESSDSSDMTHWTRKQVFTNKTIYLLMPLALMPPFALTGAFFHQAAIAELKGWSLAIMASGLIFFAIGRSSMTFLTGPVVDRYSAKKLFAFYQLPLSLGFLILAMGQQTFIPAISFSLFGLSVGSGAPIKSSIWAELYGLKHLGAIKSSLATLMVLSTAASPILFGWIIDVMKEPTTLLYALFIASLISAGLAYVGVKNHNIS